jgi:spermidine synthase
MNSPGLFATLRPAVTRARAFLSGLKRPQRILFLVGACLSIVQFIMIRDFVAILYGEEVVIVLVTAAFFAGLSAGYALSLRLSRPAFERLFIASAFLHLSFPFSYRYAATLLAKLNAGGYGFLLLLFGYALLITAAYAAFLPRLIAQPDNGKNIAARLRRNYGLELLGFLAGLMLVALGWNRPVSFLLVLYWLLLGVLLHLALGRWRLTASFAGVALGVSLFLPQLDFHSSALVYEYKHRVAGARMLYSVNSPYQKVDVVESRYDERLLYLNGLMNLNASDLRLLNYYIAELPARLVRPERALLIGNGTLSSVATVYPHAGTVTSVELDAGVLAASRYFVPPSVLRELERWQLHVDDAKHFLLASREKFDLIVMDVPSPLTLQVAYLHTVEFYRLANERLTDEGVISVQISGELQRNDRTPARVAAALRSVFPEVMVVGSRHAERGFAYAARRLPFTSEDIRREATRRGDTVSVIEPGEVGGYLVNAKPLSVNTMDLVLRRGWERFWKRYF